VGAGSVFGLLLMPADEQCEVYRRNLSAQSDNVTIYTPRDIRHSSQWGVNGSARRTSLSCTCLPAYGLNVPGGLIENSVFVDRRKTPPASKRSVVYGLAERKGEGVGEGSGVGLVAELT